MRLREERRQNADTLTRYPTYPFAFSTCARTGLREWGDEERERGEGGREEYSPPFFSIDDVKSRYVRQIAIT